MFYVMLVYGLILFYVVSYIVCWCIFHNIDYFNSYFSWENFKENPKRPFSDKKDSLLTKPNTKCPFCYVHHTHSHSHTFTTQKGLSLFIQVKTRKTNEKPSTVKKCFNLNDEKHFKSLQKKEKCWKIDKIKKCSANKKKKNTRTRSKKMERKRKSQQKQKDVLLLFVVVAAAVRL